MPVYNFLIRTRPVQPLREDEPLPEGWLESLQRDGVFEWTVECDTPEEAQAKYEALQRHFDEQ